MEQLVGGRWYAALGALAVTIGVGLFVKLAYDQGWLRIAPVWRCVGGAAFGAALLIAADWLRKRWGAWAAFGAYAAGLGALFVSTYASYRLYSLLPAPLTFLLLGSVAVLGIGIGARARLSAVSVLSLVTGFVVPFLFSNAPDIPWALPAYLLTLLTISLVLSNRMGDTFAPVRQVGVWGVLALGGFWTLREGGNHPWLAHGLLALVWTLVHAEILWTTLRATRANPSPHQPDRTHHSNIFRAAAAAVAVSTSSTSWWTLLGAHNAEKTGVFPHWLIPLTACAGQFLLSVLLSGSPLAVMEKTRSRAHLIAQCMLGQAGVLLGIAIALALSGPTQITVWLALGVMAALGAWRTRAKPLRVYALLILCVATLRLVTIDLLGALPTATDTVAGLAISPWMLAMSAAGACWLLAMFLHAVPRDAQAAPPTPNVMSVLRAAWPLVVFLTAFLHTGSQALSIFYAWLLVIAVYALCRGNRRVAKDMGAIVLLFAPFLLLAWRCVAPLAMSEGGPGLESAIAAAALSLVALALMGWSARSRPDASVSLTLQRVALGIALCVGIITCAAAMLVTPSARPAAHVLGLALSRWSLFLVIAAALWLALMLWSGRHAIATVLGVAPDEPVMAVVRGAWPLLLLCVGLSHIQSSALAMTYLWLLLVLAYAAARGTRHTAMDLGGSLLILLPAVAWFFLVVRPMTRTIGVENIGPSYDLGTAATGLVVAAACGGLAWWVARGAREDQGTRRPLRRVHAACAATLGFIASSLLMGGLVMLVSSDVTARRAVISLWWGVLAVTLIAAGFTRRIPAVRHAGLALLGAAALKVVTFDLIGVPAGWRIASFIGLGLLMLGVAVGYGKASVKAGASENP